MTSSPCPASVARSSAFSRTMSASASARPALTNSAIETASCDCEKPRAAREVSC